MQPMPFARSRWAAFGAAVAVAVGAGGVGLLHATAPTDAAAFVPITPCRLLDTRPASTVGPRATPLGADEEYDVAAVGPQGDCDLPGAAVGLSLNVTAVGATQDTFLTFYPDGAERPTVSHLNPSAGAKPTPNAVTVDLSDAGAFTVFNRFGSVDVLADVVGYYTSNDNRYYTKAEVQQIVADAVDAGGGGGAGATTYTKAQVDQRIADAVAATRGRKSWAAGTAYYDTDRQTALIVTAPYTAPHDWLCTVTASGEFRNFSGAGVDDGFIANLANVIRIDGETRYGVNEQGTETDVWGESGAASRTTVFGIPAGSTFEFGVYMLLVDHTRANIIIAYDCEPAD